MKFILEQIIEYISWAYDAWYLRREKAKGEKKKKKKWESIFAYGKSIVSKYKLTEDDVNKEIQKEREEKNKSL
jgi:hypothetical protein